MKRNLLLIVLFSILTNSLSAAGNQAQEMDNLDLMCAFVEQADPEDDPNYYSDVLDEVLVRVQQWINSDGKANDVIVFRTVVHGAVEPFRNTKVGLAHVKNNIEMLFEVEADPDTTVPQNARIAEFARRLMAIMTPRAAQPAIPCNCDDAQPQAQ